LINKLLIAEYLKKEIKMKITKLNIKPKFKFPSMFLVGALFLSCQAKANVRVAVSIISLSAHAPWYIVNEKDLSDKVDIDVQVTEDTIADNAGLSSGDVQCMMTTVDSTVVTAAAELPVKHIAVPLVSYGLDQRVVDNRIQIGADIRGQRFAANYGLQNHRWTFLTLKRSGILFKEARVIDSGITAAKRIDNSIIEALYKQGVDKKYSSNKWIGRLAN
jgi:ABC-type nitrate/sulfonate/bicarbonate transport system substrate-binding protein